MANLSDDDSLIQGAAPADGSTASAPDTHAWHEVRRAAAWDAVTESQRSTAPGRRSRE